MNPLIENGTAFIRVNNRLFNLRFVKKIELSERSLIITVPDGDGETDHYLHEDVEATYAALLEFCVN